MSFIVTIEDDTGMRADYTPEGDYAGYGTISPDAFIRYLTHGQLSCDCQRRERLMGREKGKTHSFGKTTVRKVQDVKRGMTIYTGDPRDDYIALIRSKGYIGAVEKTLYPHKLIGLSFDRDTGEFDHDDDWCQEGYCICAECLDLDGDGENPYDCCCPEGESRE